MEAVPSIIKAALLETNGGNLEIFSVLWLDATADESEEDIQIQEKLRVNINCLKIFIKLKECQEYIENMSANDRTILIVSGTLGQTLVPSIHHYRQISSIYVFCMDKERNDEWAKDFKKIKGVITDDDELIVQVVKDHKQQQKLEEPFAFNILKKENSIDGLSSIFNSQFTYSHLLIDFLLQLESNSTDKSELFSLCRDAYRDNTFELKILDDFQYKYSPKKALWWYSLAAFPYKMLNKALRTQNIHLLYLYRFFMNDIYLQLHNNQCRTAVRVYRGQFMTNDEIKVLRDSKDQIISMNSLLSTSLNRNVALKFADENQSTNSDLQRVLFKIDADPSCDTTKPFANISQESEFGDENEILFTMNSAFRINTVHRGENNTCIIRMTFCNDNEDPLKSIFDYIKNRHNNKEIDLLHFCDILKEMKKIQEAKIYNLRFLQMSPRNLSDISTCYFNLGCLTLENNDYESSLKWHRESLEIRLRLPKSNHSNLGDNYFHIGLIYEKEGDYKQALEHYSTALYTWKQINGKNNHHVITCYIQLGRLKRKMKKYSEALHDYEKALTAWRKHLSTDDFHLGILYYDIGHVHENLVQFDQALEYYSLALKTYQKCIPLEHLKVASVLQKMGSIYEDKGSFIQAFVYYEKTADIYRVLFSEGHPDLNRIEENIKNITLKLERNQKVN